jgi:trans-aconitate methyltransferase
MGRLLLYGITMEPFDSITAKEAERFMLGNSHPIRELVAQKVGAQHVIDLGCGRGIKIKELYTHTNYIGIDCSSELIKLAQQDNPLHTFWVADILDFLTDYEDNAIPVCIMISVLEHVPTLEIAQQIYNEAKRVAKVLYVGWHHPPYYKETKIIEVKAELDSLMYQNHYKEGSFDNPIRVEKVKLAELWTVCI